MSQGPTIFGRKISPGHDEVPPSVVVQTVVSIEVHLNAPLGPLGDLQPHRKQSPIRFLT